MIPIKITLKDNSPEVMALLEQNITAALTAVGIKAVNLILWQMRQGFGRPIRKSGTLQGDVNYEIHPETKSVDVGNSKTYAIYVHDGTSRMAARPYITNALTGDDHAKQLMKAAADQIKAGF